MRETKFSKLDRRFLDRWSPRGFLGDAIPKEDLETMIEAARWAPSCFNEQPWRYFVASSEEDRRKVADLLAPKNQTWAKHAPALVIVFSVREFSQNQKPNRWADFDTGLATMSLILQAHQLGYVCHGMGGFSEDQAYEISKSFGVSRESHHAICVVAIGRHDPLGKNLPEDIKAREVPSDRKEFGTFWLNSKK